jgi:hypothetical protein
MDLLEARNKVRFSDSTTNLEETGVSLADFWSTQSMLLEGKTLDHSTRLLVTFDVPASDSGLLACKYTPKPFSAGGGTIISRLTNSWTLPGAITHPHMDGIACAMYIIHWKGAKLWIMWPPTASNLRAMEHSMTTSSHLDTTIRLFSQLEGMEVMVLTEEDYFEFAFCLLPNTIHCCLSFTECCHAGMPIRDIQFLSTVETVMDWAHDWLRERLIPEDAVGDDEKRQVVEKYKEAVRYWTLVKKQRLADAENVRVTAVLDKAAQLVKYIGKQY